MSRGSNEWEESYGSTQNAHEWGFDFGRFMHEYISETVVWREMEGPKVNDVEMNKIWGLLGSKEYGLRGLEGDVAWTRWMKVFSGDLGQI